ncbi:uncharacterized protein Dvir_GJ27132 [Drosophila virilis]|uniref:Uncharacterized protein n=1 Tax=Drosophila virilis TaxID=7244 RepID=A0A0Q9WEH2_DROVI|nr:uncharacterized protein Dvir_GJ27132 [Drosophila virilis]
MFAVTRFLNYVDQCKAIGSNIYKILNRNSFYRMVFKSSIIFLLGTYVTKEFEAHALI